MVDENVNVAEEPKPVDETPKQPEPESAKPAVDSRPQYDEEAVNAIKQQVAQQNEKLKELDRIKKAIIGEDITTGMNEKEKERFSRI